MAAGLMLASADMYAVATLLPAVVQDFDIPIDHLERGAPIVSGFLLGYVMALPLLAAYADPRGRARVFAAALLVFAAGSLATVLAADLALLVGARVVQGLAGGALVPLALSTAAELFPPGRRLLALGLLGAAQELGSLTGPLAGALLAQAAPRLGWRAIFWLDLPLALVCAAGFRAAIRHLDARAVADSAVDWPGAVLLALALGLIVVALYPDDPQKQAVGSFFVPALAGAAVVGGAFALQQARRRASILPASVFSGRASAGGLAANLLVGAALAAALVDVPLLARTVLGLGATGAALQLARLMAGIVLGAFAGGLLARALGGAAVVAGGCLLAAGGMWAAGGFSGETLGLRWGPVTAADPPLVAAGCGFGLVIAPLTAAVVEAGGRARHAASSSLVVLARTMGMLAGISVLTAIGLHRFYQLLGPAPRLVPGSPHFTEVLRQFEARALAALTAEFSEIFHAAALLLVAAAVVAVLTLGRGPALRRP